MMNDKPRILIVDDDESTCKTLMLILGKKGYEAEAAGTGQEALEKAQERLFNAALLDLRLPDVEGVELLAPLKEIRPAMAVIVITGHASVETAVQAMDEGASSYITKPLNIDEVLATIREALEKQRLIEERRQAEEALRESEAKMRSIFRAAPVGIGVVSGQVLLDVNDRFCEITGYSRHELVGENARMVYPSAEDYEYVGREKYRQIREQGTGAVETRFKRKDGAIIEVLLSSTPLDPNELSAGFTWTALNITERKRLERETEERRLYLESVLNSAPDAIVTLNAQHRIIEWNPGAERLFGYTREEASGQNIDALVAGPDTDKHDEAVEFTRRILDGGTVRPLETVRYRKDGSAVNVIVSASPILLNGRRIGAVGVYKDITKRVRSEEERTRLVARVREQAQELRQVLATVPEGVILLNAEGRVLQANPTAEEELTVLAGADVGDVITRLGDRPLEELLTSPPTKGLWHEVEAETPSGRRTFEIIGQPVEKGSAPEHWVLVVSDVTREREIQTQLQRQERLAAVGQLAGGIAHDFNNIIATIVLYARMLEREESLSDRDRERVSVISQQAWHATRLIEQILDFSRQAVLERRPVDLLPLLKEQVKLLERTLPEHVEIELQYEQDEYTVRADPTRMQQMLTNLAVNARDAMPRGGLLRIGVRRLLFEQDQLPLPREMEPGEWIRLTVTDTGAGIPPDVLPYIFEPFFTTKQPGEGSGLGLAQVHGIVGQHGGCIDVDTEVDEGTTFSVYLPALEVRSAEPPLADVSAAPQGRGEVVLVVEDDAALRAALVASLERLNYRPLEAANGKEALAILEERAEVADRCTSAQIALVLSDVVMPGMGGIALLHALRKKDWRTPVILLTGHAMDEELEELRALGLSAWLNKPPDLDQLARAVDGVLCQSPRRK